MKKKYLDLYAQFKKLVSSIDDYDDPLERANIVALAAEAGAKAANFLTSLPLVRNATMCSSAGQL